MVITLVILVRSPEKTPSACAVRHRAVQSAPAIEKRGNGLKLHAAVALSENRCNVPTNRSSPASGVPSVNVCEVSPLIPQISPNLPSTTTPDGRFRSFQRDDNWERERRSGRSWWESGAGWRHRGRGERDRAFERVAYSGGLGQDDSHGRAGAPTVNCTGWAAGSSTKRRGLRELGRTFPHPEY